jgi:O-antigen/teichoic acid export membrane protein
MTFCIALGLSAIAINRAIVGEPLLVTYRDSTVSSALGTSVALSLLLSVVLMISALFVHGSLSAGFIVVAAGLPIVLVQDTCRYVFFARRVPLEALWSDIAWTIGQFGGIVAIVWSGRATSSTILACWVGGSALGAGWALNRLRVRIAPGKMLAWIRSSRELSLWLGAQTVVAQAGTQCLIVVTGVIAGLGAVGGLRAAQTIAAPFGLILAAAPPLVLPDLRELARRSLRRLVPASVRVSLLASAAALVYGGVIVVARAPLLPGIFGGAFSRYSAILVPVAISLALQASAVGPGLGSRALLAGRAVFVAQAVATLVGILLVAVLASRYGAIGAAWGIAGQGACLALMSWLTFSRALSARAVSGLASEATP